MQPQVELGEHMHEPGLMLVYTTTSNYEEARAIGERLLKQRMVACVNIVPKMHAMYLWKGKLEHAEECIMLAKTPEDNVDAVMHLIKTHHSYEVPCILVFRVVDCSGAYSDYVYEETKEVL